MAVMPDEELIPAVTKYMQEKPYLSRHKLRQRFGTSVQRLEKLAADGKIPPLPDPLPLRSFSIMGARASSWRHDFKLAGSPDTGGKRTKPVKVK